MKRILFLLVFLLVSASIFSCRKKKNEPLPPKPIPEIPLPEGNPGSIVLTMPEAENGTKEYSFELQMKGSDIHVTGTTKKEDKTDSRNRPYTIYTAPAGGRIIFSGKITLFNISKGRVQTADLSKAPTTLTAFGMRSTQTTSVDLSGATELRHLIYRDQKTNEIDLSKQNKVITMELGREVVNNNGSMKKVIMPSPSDVEVLNISDEGISEIDLTNLPKLKSFRAFGVKVDDIDLRNSPMLEEIYLTQGYKVYESLRIKNTPNLFRVYIKNVPFKEISIENASQLGNSGELTMEEVQKRKLSVYTGYDRIKGLYFDGATRPTKTCVITGTAITKFTDKTKFSSETLEKLDLSNNKLVEINLGFPKLKELDLSKNQLNGDNLNKIIEQLPQAKEGKFKADNVSTQGEQTLRAKGWSVIR